MKATRGASDYDGNFSKPASLVASNPIVMPAIVMYNAYCDERLLAAARRGALDSGDEVSHIAPASYWRANVI
jgi:hypothetical protein